MGNWYRVTKKIHGRLYDYWQRTYRIGKSVKTENRYIGPSSPYVARTVAPQVELSSPTRPYTPEEAIAFITPFTAQLDGKDRRDYERERAQARAEDERIQYGPLKVRLKRQRQQFLAAKRKTRGIKSVNPFIAQAMQRKPRATSKPTPDAVSASVFSDQQKATNTPTSTAVHILNKADALSWSKPNVHSTEVASQLLDEFQPHLSDWEAEFCRSLIRWKDRKGFSPKQIEKLKEVARNAVNHALIKK